MRFVDYCHQVTKLATYDTATKQKISFNIFDHNSDGKVGLEDIMKVMKDLKSTDWLISEDCQIVNKALNDKSQGRLKPKSILSPEMGLAMKKAARSSEVKGSPRAKINTFINHSDTDSVADTYNDMPFSDMRQKTYISDKMYPSIKVEAVSKYSSVTNPQKLLQSKYV